MEPTVLRTSTSSWAKGISTQGTLRAVALDAKDLIEDACSRHGITDRVRKQALGEALVAGLLMATYLKKGERINLKIQGDGPAGGAIVDASPEGWIRGFTIPGITSFGLASEEVRGPWGEGILSILKTQDQESRLPYLGSVPLITGHLAKDLTFYWLQSEQLNSGVGIKVELLDDGRVKSAGGFLLQVLPGASDQELEAVEAGILTLNGLADAFAPGFHLPGLLSQILGAQGMTLLEETALRFDCPCSRSRVAQTLLLLEFDELEEMLRESQETEVMCDFCGSRYVFGPSDVEACLKEKRQPVPEPKT